MNPTDDHQNFPPLKVVPDEDEASEHDLINVELVTSAGCVWRGLVASAGISLNAGSLDITSPSEAYLHFPSFTTLTLRSANGPLAFQLEDAAASIQGGKLTVLAKTVVPCIAQEGT